jgi:hypothetical protein
MMASIQRSNVVIKSAVRRKTSTGYKEQKNISAIIRDQVPSKQCDALEFNVTPLDDGPG